MSLLALQRGLRDHILAGTEAPPAGVDACAAPGLAVYRHAYRAQLVACLRDVFEKTWSWLGDEAFDDAAQEHVEQRPPSSWTLGEYGDDFPRTLERLYPHDPEVAEIAWLDLTLRRAFDGPDASPIASEALAAVDWESAVLEFAPTLVLGEVVSNAAAIWGAIAEGKRPPAAERLPAPAALRVWRSDLSPRYRTMDAFEHRALALALAGLSFGGLCTVLAEGADAEAAAPRLGGLLGAWLQDGLIRGVV